MNTAASWASPVQNDRYIDGAFSKCEKCDGKLEDNFWSTKDVVYTCNTCGFEKSYSHVSFGFSLKVPNYWSITKSHSADNLQFANGDSIRNRILVGSLNRGVIVPVYSIAQKKWDAWIDENTIEIVKLASLADMYNLGADPRLDPVFDPMRFLRNRIKEQQGIYLTLVSLKGSKKFKKGQKIGQAINYALQRSKGLIWLGGNHSGHPTAKILTSAATRMHRYHAEFYGYKSYDKYKSHLSKGFTIFEGPEQLRPIYITGPSMYECKKLGFTIKSLDKYVSKFLTDFDNSLEEHNGIKVIVNTGNSGIDSSVARWAVKNNKYIVVVNLSTFMYQNENGYNRYGDAHYTIRRLLNTAFLDKEYTDVITIGTI